MINKILHDILIIYGVTDNMVETLRSQHYRKFSYALSKFIENLTFQRYFKLKTLKAIQILPSESIMKIIIIAALGQMDIEANCLISKHFNQRNWKSKWPL